MYADPRSVDKILLLVETLQTNRSNTDCRDIRHTAIASQHNILFLFLIKELSCKKLIIIVVYGNLFLQACHMISISRSVSILYCL